MHDRERARINNSDLIRLVAPINRAVWERRVRAVLTDRENFIAALSSIEINGNEAALRTSEQARRVEKIGKFGRSRDSSRVHGAVEEIQRLTRHDDEQLN